MDDHYIIDKWVENASEESGFTSKDKYFPFYLSTDVIKWYLYLNLKESLEKNKIQFCMIKNMVIV